MHAKGTGLLLAATFLGGLGAATTPANAQGTAPGINQGFFERLTQAYMDELFPSPAAAPNPGTPSPDAPVTRRPAPFPPQPVTQPPYPFTDWPYGGASTIGASVPNAVASPLMRALSPTPVGKALEDAGIQVYGWINPGLNFSTSTNRKGGNFPAAYMYNPNTIQLDQVALFVERVPDTVQRDHVDWGFRVAGIYGENYRYTTALGLFSYQLQKKNNIYGYDLPMVYGEVYVPQVADGLLIRFGRYISVPDIEAQLAPNNYMYSHSMTYAFDNYTNTGAIASLRLNRNWMVQGGVTVGTDSMPWEGGRDPGIAPSYTACVRWDSDDSMDNVYACANGINGGRWGYNNLQQYVFTYYHKFNERWHLAWETWHMHQNRVANVNATGGSYDDTPFRGFRNAPFQANCNTGSTCTAQQWSTLAYLNYRVGDNDNISLRAEWFDDMQGQRTGVKTRYANWAIGWQHWFSPSVLIRPELAQYNALDRGAFDGGTKRAAFIASADLIFRF